MIFNSTTYAKSASSAPLSFRGSFAILDSPSTQAATPAKLREGSWRSLESDIPRKLITAFGGNHVGRIYTQTTIDEATPRHMLTRWAPPNTSNWSVDEVGRLKRLPPPVLIEQDGFLVSRGFNGGLRPSSSALRCDRLFDHACYGKVGQHVHIITILDEICSMYSYSLCVGMNRLH